MKKKVAVAMSGGVDSGVAAALLVKHGYKCAGFHMKLWQEEASSVKRLASSLEAARKTAHLLGIPFYPIDFSEIFKEKVVDYFLKEYSAGLTPNPCVVCNKFIKFGELLDYAKELGYDYLATGHYARLSEQCQISNVKCQNQNLNLKTFYLLQAKDRTKDQSYFLYNLTQQQLAHILFPVGNYTKEEVRKMAKRWSLPVAERPESQEICFFPESDYRPFLKRQIREKIIPGEVVGTKRRVVGKHQGIPLYTIGQRHGFTITDKKVIGPLYVIGKNIAKNQLIVGFGKEAERKEFWVKNVNWLAPRSPSEVGISCFVRIRHQGELLPCRVTRDTAHVTRKNVSPANLLRVTLSESERGIAPGQAAVFYKNSEVLGGGIIALDKD